MIRSYSSLLFWLAMTIASSVALYHTSDRVNFLDKELRKIRAEIEDERTNLHVLKAEWVYLSNPARIGIEAARHLNLQPTSPNRVADIKHIGYFLAGQPDDALALARLFQGAAETPSARAAQAKPRERPRTEHDRVLASLNAGRINDRMTIQHSAATAVAKQDKIGALIGQLGLLP